MQPLLDGTDVRFDPVNTSDGGVKVKENSTAGAVFAENPHGGGKGRKRSRESTFMFLRVGPSAVAGKADAGLPGKQKS
ncbi:hypothetical protein GCM10023346_48540 [Arthrobacter gyeryongensis]|uniref:CSD domain-containing protein n=1 Tax=Arthrobacter gyeryongensis TaxID=1650592 RepID=A0ABP9SSX8_9MICC